MDDYLLGVLVGDAMLLVGQTRLRSVRTKQYKHCPIYAVLFCTMHCTGSLMVQY